MEYKTIPCEEDDAYRRDDGVWVVPLGNLRN